MNTMANLWLVPTSGALGYVISWPLLNWSWVCRKQHRIYKQYRLWR